MSSINCVEWNDILWIAQNFFDICQVEESEFANQFANQFANNSRN